MQWMMIGNAVDGGRGNVNHALNSGALRSCEDRSRAFDVGRVDLLFGIERKGGGRVDDVVGAVHRESDGSLIPNITFEDIHLIADIVVGIVSEVERGNREAPVQQIASQIDS